MNMSSKHSIKRKYDERFVIVTNFPGKNEDPMFLAWQNPTYSWNVEDGYFWASEQTLIEHLQSCPDSNARPHVYAFETEIQARLKASELRLRMTRCPYEIKSILIPKKHGKATQSTGKYALPGISLNAWFSLCAMTDDK
jgi:hypothetical protein